MVNIFHIIVVSFLFVENFNIDLILELFHFDTHHSFITYICIDYLSFLIKYPSIFMTKMIKLKYYICHF